MSIRIALAGNPNCGKTTLFNLLTGSDCHVGNWPGVTVDKRSGIIKSLHGAELVDLPGIYSLRTLSDEEGAALGFLINEKPDLIAYAAKLTKNGYIDYTNPKSLVKATGDTIDAVVQKTNEESLDPVILNDPSYQPPYIISPEDFAIDDEYTIVNLNYYIDGVLTDEDDNIVENVDDVVGLENLNHMGEYEDDALHIRNENYKCEYEILLSRRLYHDTTEVN